MATGNVVSDSNRGARQNVKLGNSIVQSFYNIVVFTATSREEWLAVFEKGIGAYFYLGSFIGLVIFKAGLYAYDLIVSKNKNIGKVFSFIREFIAMIILLVAAIGGMVASVSMATIIPWLYVASMIVSLVYNFSIAIQNAYHWAKSNNEEARCKYKESFKIHLFASGFVGILTISLVFIMAIKVATTAMAILSACLNAVSFIMGAHAAYKMYKANKQVENPVVIPEILDELNNDLDDKAGCKKKKSNENLQILQSGKQYDDDYYFHCKNRAEELIEQNDPKNYLLQQIHQKIGQLTDQINHDRNKFFSQETKRLIKIAVLGKLKDLVNDPLKTQKNLYALLKDSEFNNFFNNPFQSFFRQKSDTQDIFEAAERFFNKFRQPTEVEMICVKSFGK